MVGVSLAALSVGAGLSYWRQRATSEADDKSNVQEASPDVAAFWAHMFETPAGASLRMADFKGKPLLVNFWATWCPPCIEELPLLDSFYRENTAAGWQVLGIAIDKPAMVQQFLAKKPLSFPVVMDGGTGTQWSKALGNLAGALPFSVAFSADSVPIYRKMGKLSASDLDALRRG
jgi:thiol-disulfide isomerase/thioredoxin